jgi:hypothetical protein
MAAPLTAARDDVLNSKRLDGVNSLKQATINSLPREWAARDDELADTV